MEKDPAIYLELDEVDLSPKVLKADLNGINKMTLGQSIPKFLLHDQDEGIRVLSIDGQEVNITTIYYMEGGRHESSGQMEVLFEEPLDLGKNYIIQVEGYGENLRIKP